VQVFKIYGKLREGAASIPGGPIVAGVELMFSPPPSTYVLWERGQIALLATRLSQPSIPFASVRLRAMRRPQPCVGSDACIALWYMMHCAEAIELPMAVWYCAV
jgi:hypothetical protein